MVWLHTVLSFPPGYLDHQDQIHQLFLSMRTWCFIDICECGMGVCSSLIWIKHFQHSQIFYNDKKNRMWFIKKYLNYIHTLRQFSQCIDARWFHLHLYATRGSLWYCMYCTAWDMSHARPVSVTQMDILIYSVAIDFWLLNAITEQTESSIPETSRVLSTQVEDSQVT